jgi:uroporphyrin-III C-methyltransferase
VVGGVAGGFVSLVGAGPGDPELLTVGALRRLRDADVVVHDALVGDGVLALIPSGVERIDVGKRPGRAVQQAEICALLVELSEAGRRVVRLKGGDPFVFGRGGEEAEALRAAGVAYEVVPGVSSVIAAPAAAGIPITHRGVSTGFTVVTGHRQQGEPPVNWDAIAHSGGTLVVLMGVAQRAEIAAALIAAGLAAHTPVAAVRQATTGDEEITRTTLGGLGDADVRSPATLVIGAVAAFDLRPRESDTASGRPASGTAPASGAGPAADAESAAAGGAADS